MTAIKRGLYLAPFDSLADPRLLAELAGRAGPRGCDGRFLAGATWVLTRFAPQPTEDVLRAVVEAGP